MALNTGSIIPHNFSFFEIFDRFNKVEDIITEGILSGKKADEITEAILKATDMDANRARFWAEDQAAIFQAEQKRIAAIRGGYTHYRWKKGGANSRASHAIHDGKIYSWNVGVNNLTRPGARHPGEDYRCHCDAELLTTEQALKLGGTIQPPRTPQPTAGLMENYYGSEESKVEKGKRFIESLGQIFNSVLRSGSLKPNSGTLILGTPQEKAEAETIAQNLKTYKLSTIESNEALILGSPLEIAVIEDNGEFVPVVGEKNYVDLPSGKLKGKRLTYNHPSNTPISLPDMEVFVKEELKEIRVVTKGNVYAITNSENKKLDFKAIKKTYDESYEEASKKAIERFIKGDIEKRDLENEVRHIQWEITKKEHGFEYERKKW